VPFRVDGDAITLTPVAGDDYEVLFK
jgi:hypothetical protein